ncbi:hypothetical protein SBA4_1920015 [Candidatus Sulfopaludibacter sp. SbA4]|nr:hypothetical protein SBA4_1920015 [Candidatus Sulfopaludibacter sp. SbA4]
MDWASKAQRLRRGAIRDREPIAPRPFCASFFEAQRLRRGAIRDRNRSRRGRFARVPLDETSALA